MSEDFKFFFLVAGFDYASKPTEKTFLDFRSRCTNRLYERIEFYEKLKTQKKEGNPVLSWSLPVQLRFFLFDFGKGQIKVYDHQLKPEKRKHHLARTREPWLSLPSDGTNTASDPTAILRKTKTFRAVELDDFAPGKKLSLKSGVVKRVREGKEEWLLSITDVYEAVRTAPRGSVVELSFFSHSYWKGPILLNSSEADGTPWSQRDENDTDGRGSKDFTSHMGMKPITDVSRLSKFLEAFDGTQGHLVSWGCNAGEREFTGDQLDRFIAAIGSRRQLRDTDTIIFKDDLGDRKERTIKEVLSEILRRALFKQIYPYRAALAATNLKIPLRVVGACSGTRSDNENTGYQLMHILRGELKYAEIYKRFLGVKIDKRGYGIFDQDALERLKDFIPADPPDPPLP